MTDTFPPSPFPGHAFLPNEPDGSLLGTLIAETEWIVVLQRDGTMRGPRPAMCYGLRHRGGPTDIMALHIHETPSEAQQRLYKDADDVINADAPSGTAGKDKAKTNERNGGPHGRSADDVFGAVMGGIGLIGALGTLAVAAIAALDGEEE